MSFWPWNEKVACSLLDFRKVPDWGGRRNPRFAPSAPSHSLRKKVRHRNWPVGVANENQSRRLFVAPLRRRDLADIPIIRPAHTDRRRELATARRFRYRARRCRTTTGEVEHSRQGLGPCLRLALDDIRPNRGGLFGVRPKIQVVGVAIGGGTRPMKVMR